MYFDLAKLLCDISDFQDHLIAASNKLNSLKEEIADIENNLAIAAGRTISERVNGKYLRECKTCTCPNTRCSMCTNAELSFDKPETGLVNDDLAPVKEPSDDTFRSNGNYTDLSSEAKLSIGNLGNLILADRWMGGYRYQYKFHNGYGISIIKHFASYGGEGDKWEIGVLDSNNELCYDTPITDDMIGWLTDREVMDYAKRISSLPNYKPMRKEHKHGTSKD